MTEAEPLSLPFPPLGNRMLLRLGVADVSDDPGFFALREQVVATGTGRVRLAPHHDEWLTAAVQSANDQSYRFELRCCHGPGEPFSVDVEEGTPAGAIEGFAVREGRGTAKIVVLLGIEGQSAVSVGAHGVDQSVQLAAGRLLLAPAYLSLHVTEAPKVALRVLRTTVHGPAFR